jgi:hypothetical protein
LYLQNSQIRELPRLKSVGRVIYTNKKTFDYWREYFFQTGRPNLAKKLVVIRV